MEKKTGIMALMQFFGRKEGQGIKEFKAEIDQLSPEAKIELIQLAEEALATAEPVSKAA